MMNTLTFPILRLLSDGKFHSGEAISKHFKVSRATVWNALQDAVLLGVEVYAVRGRGYKLPQAVSFLEQRLILDSLGNDGATFNIEVHDCLPSTNTYLMQHLGAYPHASFVVTNLQTGGRGRRGREWLSGLGASIACSLLWRFQLGAAMLSGLSLAVGVALIRVLHVYGLTDARLKWPNDILVNQKKLAGILIELQGDMEGSSSAVIGIGINLSIPEDIRHKIDQPVTDLNSHIEHRVEPNRLLATLLKQLSLVLTEFERHGFDKLRNEWAQHHAYHQKNVRMLMPDGSEQHGMVQGVAEDGSLLVSNAQGVQRFISGEISMRSLG